MLEIQRAQIPEGRPYNSKLRMYAGDKLCYIDLQTEENDKHVPNDEFTLINRPYKFGRQLVLQNRGPASIRYAINQPKGSTTCDIIVRANEGDNWEMNSWPVIYSLSFLVDTPGDTYADIIFIVMV